jgi:DASH complex subunit DAM1
MDNAPTSRSTSRSRLPQRSPISRPTTPLRPSSRSSFRNSQNNAYHSSQGSGFPLDALEAQFGELADSMADLEANFMHLQLMHESLSRFGESFASFLYGLNMRAFCVDFPEVSCKILVLRARLGAVLTGAFCPGSGSRFNQAVQQAATISRSARDVYTLVTAWD